MRIKQPEKSRGIAYKMHDKIIINERMPFVENLDEILFPCRDFIDYSRYDSIGMMSARGCRYNCLFCQPILRRLFGNKVRERNIQNIIEEMDYVAHRYPGKKIRFEDDTFTMHDIGWFEQFNDELKKRNSKARWSCNSRVDTIDINKAKIMKESGCVQIAFGIESGSKKVLDFYGKGVDHAKTKNLFDDLKKIGILTHGYFMLGAPMETKDDLMATYQLVKSLKPDKLITYNVTPLPGSDLFNYCKNEDLLNIKSWEDYDNSINNYEDVFPIKLKFIKEKDIKDIKKKIDFYMLYHSIFNLWMPKILFTEPRRVIRALVLMAKKYFV